MVRAVALFLVACSVAVCTSARAEFWSGNDLKTRLEEWDHGTSSVDAWMGAGYVLGVHDALSGKVICSGVNVTPKELIDAALKHLRDNPEVLNVTADRIVARSLKAVWPCSKDSDFAKFWRGNVIQSHLQNWSNQNTEDLKNASIAAGYLNGVADAANGVVLCPPDGATNGQITAITLKVMRQKPEILDWWADRIILEALRPLWPCQASNQAAASTAPQAAVKPVHRQAKPKPPPQADSPF